MACPCPVIDHYVYGMSHNARQVYIYMFCRLGKNDLMLMGVSQDTMHMCVCVDVLITHVPPAKKYK